MAIESNIGYSQPSLEAFGKNFNLINSWTANDEVCNNSVFAEGFSPSEITYLCTYNFGSYNPL